MDFQTFCKLKREFIAKHSEDMLYGDAAVQKTMLTEIEPLAAYAKLPPDQFLSKLARYVLEINQTNT